MTSYSNPTVLAILPLDLIIPLLSKNKSKFLTSSGAFFCKDSVNIVFHWKSFVLTLSYTNII